jgi:plasmid replication initiation protein
MSLTIKKGLNLYNIDMNSKTISIQKDSQLVSIYASGQLTATQKKIYNALIFVTKQLLKKDEKRFKFQVDLQSLMKIVYGDNEWSYKHVKDNILAIKKIMVEYNVLGKGGKGRKRDYISIFNLLGGITIEDGIVDYNFDFQVLDFIKKPMSYVYLDLRIIKGLDSKHSIGLYEILEDYKKLGKIDIEIEKFRKAMDIGENQYTRFNNLSDKVLVPSIEEINNKTNLKVSYEKITRGRKVVGLSFKISSKPMPIDTEVSATETKQVSKIETKDYQYYLNKKLTSKEYKIIDKIRKEYQDKPFFRPFLMHGLVPNVQRYYPYVKFYMKNNLIVNENGEPIRNDGVGMTVNAINCFLADHERFLGDLEPKIEEFIGFDTDVRIVDSSSMDYDGQKVEFKIKNVEVKEDHKIVIFENEENKFAIKVPDDKEFIRVFEESEFRADKIGLSKVEKEPESEEVKIKIIYNKITEYGVDSLTEEELKLLEEQEQGV